LAKKINKRASERRKKNMKSSIKDRETIKGTNSANTNKKEYLKKT